MLHGVYWFITTEEGLIFIVDFLTYLQEFAEPQPYADWAYDRAYI